MLFVIWGYRDATEALSVRPATQHSLAVLTYLADRHGALGLGAGAVLGIAASIVGAYILALPDKKRRAWRIAAVVSLVAYSSGPLLWYVNVQDTAWQTGAMPPLSDWLTQAMLGWVTMGAAFSFMSLPWDSGGDSVRWTLARKLQAVVFPVQA